MAGLLATERKNVDYLKKEVARMAEFEKRSLSPSPGNPASSVEVSRLQREVIQLRESLQTEKMALRQERGEAQARSFPFLNSGPLHI